MNRPSGVPELHPLSQAEANGAGKRETLQCPYHAWTYDLDGALRLATGEAAGGPVDTDTRKCEPLYRSIQEAL